MRSSVKEEKNVSRCMQTMEPQSTPSKRKPNWNAEETLALTNLVDENKHIIRGKLGPNLTSDLKNRTWHNIAQTLSTMGLGPARSSSEVEKKWHNIFSKSKSEISEHRRTLSGTGGGPPPRPLSTIAETVCSVVGENNACLSGINNGIDSSLLQIIHLGENSQPLGINVVEGQPDTVPHIIQEASSGRAAERISTPVNSLDSPQDASSVPRTDLKRKMEELSYRKLQLEIEYLNLKIKKLKEE